MNRKSKTVAVIYKKMYLTGLSAGKTFPTYVICNSHKSASELAKDLRAEKVLETELTGELYQVSKIKVASFTKGVPFDYLKDYTTAG